MKFINENVQFALARVGFRLQKINAPIANFQGKYDHPLSVLYEAPPGSSVLFNIPSDRCRSFGGRTLDRQNHPLVATLSDYLTKQHNVYSGSALEAFARRTRLNDACDALGLDAAEAPGFVGIDPRGCVYPWDNYDPKTSIEGYFRTLQKEHASPYGYKHYIEGSFLKHYTEGSFQRGELEMKRLINTFESIKQKGYNRSDHIDGDIGAHLLIDREGSWCVLVHRGLHRIAALVSMGYEEIPVRLYGHFVVRSSEVNHWPQVAKGRVTAEGASKIFQRILEGSSTTTYVNVVGWP